MSYYNVIDGSLILKAKRINDKKYMNGAKVISLSKLCKDNDIYLSYSDVTSLVSSNKTKKELKLFFLKHTIDRTHRT